MEMSDYEILQRLDVAKQAARAAGAVLLDRIGRVKIERKQSFNLVTDADVAAEDTICRLISAAFPGDSFLREEGESSGTAGDDAVWIVDPLDGTNNFAHGIPQFSVSIAFATRGEVQVGVVYDPVLDEMFSAHRSGSSNEPAAFLNDQSITTSASSQLVDSIIAVGFYYERDEMMRRTLQSIERLFEVPIQGIRRFGSAALDICWVACGRFDGYFEYKLSSWDFAAAWLILEQAGGRYRDRAGEPVSLLSPNGAIASNGSIDGEFIKIVGWK